MKDDQELVEADIDGSIAHCAMLTEQGLLSAEQGKRIEQGLLMLKGAASEGTFQLSPEFEDVHMNVETHLKSLIGTDALRLHTARSRNDQVALDLRILVKNRCRLLTEKIDVLQRALIRQSAKGASAIMPGYTHLQRAQPVFYSHALLAFHEMLERDKARFQQTAENASVSPLGAAAQAGTALPVNPQSVAEKLAFTDHFRNSIDAVCDRDFAAEFLFASALTVTHLAQLAETLIIWNTSEFGFISFCDSVSFSSSLMPHKKNPDAVELVRAKAGVAIGELVNVLVTLKGLPLGYNRDLQNTKPPVVKMGAELGETLDVMAIIVDSIEINRKRMKLAACDPQLAATDLVEYLVVKGVPFRQAHEAVAQAVQLSEQAQCCLTQLSLGQYKSCCEAFEADLFELFDPVVSAASKRSPGGTGNAPDLSMQMLCELGEHIDSTAATIGREEQ